MPERSPLPEPDPAALEIFTDFLARLSGGEEPDLEALRREHPRQADDLRRLHADWQRLRPLLEKAGLGLAPTSQPSFAERLKGKYGSGVDPAISLEKRERDEVGPPTSDLLRRLSEHGLKESRYELRGEIARGGMGAILKIWDEDLRRNLAMKVILGKSDPDAPGETPPVDRRLLARFLEEAQVTGQLDHPGIVPVHELGIDSEGRVYFTMKLVKGRDLKTIFELVFGEQEGWNETRALSVILKVCEALAYAHAKGVIHRDLKPANVMVGSFGEVYVMDWGLARVLGRKDAHDLRLAPEARASTSLRTERTAERLEAPDAPLFTMDGDVVGTPAYMPPEQAGGALEKLSPRSDVYAIGAMLYHLLARALPYVPIGLRMTNRTVLAEVLRGPPMALHGIRPDIPAELVAICERAMAREPERRYPDTLALAEDLRAYLEHRVVKAYETGALAELRKWIERNKALAASAAAAVLLLVVGLTTSLVFKARSDRNAKLAEENAAQAKANAGESARNAEVAKQNEVRATESEQRALAGEAVAKEEKERAEKRADEVLRLSALQELDDLTAEADRLWPAGPKNADRYRAWIANAEKLVAALPEHEAKLAELRAKALPWTAEMQAEQPASHSRHAELETAQRHLAFHRNQTAALEAAEPPGDPTLAEMGVELATLPTTAEGLNALAWPLVDPERKNWGGEAKGLALARKAVELAAPAERVSIRDTLAWALFAAGRFDDAVAEEEKALDEASAAQRRDFEVYVTKLKKAIEDQTSPAGAEKETKHLAELETSIAELEAEVSKRPEWTFEDSQDKWWHNQLEKLVNGLKSFSDPETGLFSSGISEKDGWGIRKRQEFAATIEEQSVSGPEVAPLWSGALASIADPAECPMYGGLRMTPQLGLVPIGRDPDSGLWEFAHLQTGAVPVRDENGNLVLTEETGLVFVLLPGGTFTMGAQAKDPSGPNYDPQASSDDGPPHAVTLAPFFLSKYEMTQGQWLRFSGRNPSYYKPPQPLAPSLLHPVEQVSWTTCTEVCGRLGLVLPSEAQWEYGARGGTTTVWWTGNERESLVGAANLADQAAARAGASWPDIKDWPELDDGYAVHAQVNQYRPNPFGLHNVHGNVWEWCQDEYGSGSSPRVRRGGGFGNAASLARLASRNNNTTEAAAVDLGLRPAVGITP